MVINFISTLTLMTQVAEAQSPGMAREQVIEEIYFRKCPLQLITDTRYTLSSSPYLNLVIFTLVQRKRHSRPEKSFMNT